MRIRCFEEVARECRMTKTTRERIEKIESDVIDQRLRPWRRSNLAAVSEGIVFALSDTIRLPIFPSFRGQATNHEELSISAFLPDHRLLWHVGT